jgi:hypothetical protein
MDEIQNDFTAGLNKALSGFNAEKFMRDWQLNAMRVLRAQERMMQGMMAAARLEVRFGQELVSSRMGMLSFDNAERGETGNLAMQEYGKLTALLKEVNEELRGSFDEAVKLMREGVIMPLPEEAEEEIVAEAAPAPAPEPAPAAETVAAEPAAESVVEATPAAAPARGRAKKTNNDTTEA